MKKIVLLLVFLGCSTPLFSQTTKKEIILDENGKIISAKELEAKIRHPDNNFTYTTIENDTAIFKKVLQRRELGALQEEDRLKVIKALEEITGTTISLEKTIIINFFYEDPKKPQGCINNYITDKKYKKFIKDNPHITQFFITEKGYKYRSKKTFEDKNDFTRIMLFPNKMYCGNYVIIKPNGHIYRQIGEYRQSDIAIIMGMDW